MIDEYSYDQTPRNGGGVKHRLDQSGDGWANAHREGLPNKYMMQDVDAMFGAMAFGHNTGERLFLEYVPDGYENRGKSIRDFSVVAMFDRKTTEATAFANHAQVSRALYLWICRSLAEAQGLRPKFFLCIGGQEPPWKMIEIDIETGERAGNEAVVDSGKWETVWQTLGLQGLRNEAKRLIHSP